MRRLSTLCARPTAGAAWCCMGLNAWRPPAMRASHTALLQRDFSSGFSDRFRHKRARIVSLPRVKGIAAAQRLDFFSDASDDATTFASLGIGEDVQDALTTARFPRPSRVQELVIPEVAKGANAVVAAETGSGKTLAYLVPLASMLLRHKQRVAEKASTGSGADADDVVRERRSHALVLCPNFALCQQVQAVAESILGPPGSEPLLSAACINASNPPPRENPDIIISTPAAMVGFLNGAGPRYGWLWSPEGIQSKVRHVVLDEADLLLTKAFSKPVKQLLQLLRSGDRRRVEAKMFAELGIQKPDFDRLPRPMQHMAWQRGALGLKDAGYRLPGGWDRLQDAKFGPYWRRQYLFVAATMPSVTLSDVGSDIQRMFPDIQWLSSQLLHQSQPMVAHTWEKVSDASFRDALVSALCNDPDFVTGSAKTLIFAGSVARADEVSDLLEHEGLDHSVYHKNISMQGREEALAAMNAQSQGSARLMVCTDAAARGLDVVDITHVVQADFAPNAIDFIHRIGRTGRAGQAGKVTSLYRDSDSALVNVIKQYIADGRPLEAAFSRARSFSRKLKRAGEFVPRGFTKGQIREAQATSGDTDS